MTILQSLPDSRLVLQSHPAVTARPSARCSRQAASPAIASSSSRGLLGSSISGAFTSLDLGLDPFPYNGHTSTLDALWMGVPVITLAGRTAVGRGGVSILSNLGLPELIAQSTQQYVDISIQLASDIPRLRALRAGLRQRMRSSALMDGKQFAADVEVAFRSMWKTWCGR